ncbi:hypothetical protein GRI91_04825 [Altererythrobacter endophyticus]|uniref:Uncharacterized protein n=1 Tax=Altericroceibacterium endophyticum TaxID=1808508 RepID=A0A6I4T420_9SPHN|nr:hypothetical protein [Altericroceibacterium endophyticum]
MNAAPETNITKTNILSAEAANRLRHNSGVTLQWIGWDQRGTLNAWNDRGLIRLKGGQRSDDQPGGLTLEGVVTEIGADHFVFDGRITIKDTPDIGRDCSADKSWYFGITQNRKYWRLREFEWCDGLTDYIDIYF